MLFLKGAELRFLLGKALPREVVPKVSVTDAHDNRDQQPHRYFSGELESIA